jgi:predicted methyltransferase
MDASLLQSLKPGGLLAIIDFPPRAGLPTVKEEVPKNRNGHGVAPEIVLDEMKSSGFELAFRLDHWPEDDYCLIFRKAP